MNTNIIQNLKIYRQYYQFAPAKSFAFFAKCRTVLYLPAPIG